MDKNVLEEINIQIDSDLNSDHTMNNRKNMIRMIQCAEVVFYPKIFNYHDLTQEKALKELDSLLKKEIKVALEYEDSERDAVELSDMFINLLPEIFEILQTDVQAIYDGDPAAKSKAEVLLCYPGFFAIFIYRLAHVLYMLNIPFLPRMMTEYAHQKTGIDINPGAEIGKHFCIDHGTGIVIGETAILGDNVKLYQGVTIGAKSFEKDENGHPVKGGKRHPNIGNNVTIYANATILGGDTNIGDNCVIGGNTWIIESVEAGTTVSNK